MYADRFQHRRVDPIGLAGSLLVGGAMVGALMFIVPKFEHVIVIKPLVLRNYKDPPPPPPVTDSKPHARTKTDTPVPPLPDNPPPFVPTISDRIDWTPPTTYDFPPPTDSGPPVTKPIEPPPAVFVDASADPRYAGEVQPPYPASKIRSSEEGRVTVRVQIGADGRVKAVEPVGNTDAAFFEATKRQALAHWRFRPATRGGTPVETWKTISVRFELKETE